jgi:phage gp45-like
MDPRDNIAPQVRQAALQSFRGYKKAYADGLITGVGFDGQTLAKVHHGQPYGLRSNPPENREIVYLQTAGGLIVVTSRQDAADFTALGLSEPEDGETMLYNAQGALVHLDENGDIIHGPKSGRHVKLGDGATKALALHEDGVDKDVGATRFSAWMAAIEVLANSGAGGTCSPAAESITRIGKVQASATKVKGE